MYLEIQGMDWLKLRLCVSYTEERLHDGNYLESHNSRNKYFITRQARRFAIEDDHVPFMNRGEYIHASLALANLKWGHLNHVCVYLKSQDTTYHKSVLISEKVHKHIIWMSCFWGVLFSVKSTVYMYVRCIPYHLSWYHRRLWTVARHCVQHVCTHLHTSVEVHTYLP